MTTTHADPQPTGRKFFFETCSHCSGKGRVPEQRLLGWYLDYHYQDGHETCGPYTKAEAVKSFREHRDGTSRLTLIGPDNQVYT